MENSKVKQMFILALLFLSNCSLLDQNDLIDVGSIGTIDKISITYDLYQTGYDNYRYELSIVEKQDTTHPFKAYLNDATARNSKFSVEKLNNEIVIQLNKPIGQQSRKLGNKKFIFKGNY